MIKWIQYLNDTGDDTASLEVWIVFTLCIVIMEVMIIYIFVKSYRELKQNLPSLQPVKNHLLVMLGLIIWNIGVIIND